MSETSGLISRWGTMWVSTESHRHQARSLLLDLESLVIPDFTQSHR